MTAPGLFAFSQWLRTTLENAPDEAPAAPPGTPEGMIRVHEPDEGWIARRCRHCSILWDAVGTSFDPGCHPRIAP